MSKQATGFNQPEIDIDVLMGRKPIPTSSTQPQVSVTQNGGDSDIDMDVLMDRKPIPTADAQPEPGISAKVDETPNNPDAAFDAFLGPKNDLSPEAIRERSENSASPFAKGVRDAVGSVLAQGGYNPILGKDAVAQAAQKKVYQPLHRNLEDAVKTMIDDPRLHGYELNADNLDTYQKNEEERAAFEEVLRERYGDSDVLVSDLSTISRPMESGEEMMRSVVFTHNGKNIEIPIGLAEDWVAEHNAEVLHNDKFREDPEYRNQWFLSNLGISERTYRNEVANDLENRLQELRKKVVATLPAQHTRGGYAAIGAAANKPSSGAPVSIEKIDKALKVVNTLRKNNFGAGIKEGFDPTDILSLGVSGIGDNVALLNALNKSASGETLTKTEQALVEAWDIQNEAEEVIDTLGGRKRGANVGYGVSQALGFMAQTAGTGGIASFATKGISRAAARTALLRATNMGVNKSIKEGLRYGGLKVAESAVGAAARTPFMGFTYRNYTDKRLNQFQVKERVDEATGEISKYIDKRESSALRDATHAALESYFESQSEDVGGLIDFGITSFARALPLKGLLRNAAAEALRGPVKNGAMKLIKEGVKLHSIIGETLSEAYGDAMVNLLTANNEGWKQMASSEYWWELAQVSSILSGGFWVANQGVNALAYKDERKTINRNLEKRKNALSRIADDNLKKELTEATLTDDVIERSKRLSSLDWPNFSREDMANAVDFIDAQTRLDVMREGATESRRLARIMPAIDEVKKLADSGALDDEQAAANLATIYSDLFRTQENQRALNILTDRIRVAADAGISADKINDILRNAGLTVFNPGDEVETLTGERVFVDKVLPGAYEVVNNEGDRAVVSFEEVLQNAPEVRQIQQESNQTEGQTESAPENNPQVEQAVEAARREAAEIINKDDNTVYEVETDDGITGYIIGGKGIVVDNDGRINQSAEDTVVVKTDEGNRVVHKERVKVKNRQTLQEIEDIARGAAEGALAAVQPQQPVGGKTYQGIYDNEPVTITLPREIKFNEDGTVDYDNLMNPETVSVIRPNGAVVDEVYLSEIDELTEVKPKAEQVSADVPAVEQQELVATPAASRRLSVEEIDRVVASMEENATVAPEVELTPENWVAEFGEDGIVATPIGDVKMGENQYLKLLQRKRSKYFGMIRPTLESPDIVLEEYDPADGAERDTKMLFVKTFVKSDGSRYIHFESVTVRKEDKEVSISSHEVNAEDLKKKMHNDNVVHLNDLFSDSEMRLTRPQSEGPDLVPTPNSSDNKGTISAPQNQGVEQKNVAETVPVVQQPQIPTLKNGEPDYNAMDAEMFTEQYVARFGEDMTERLARNNIKAANKTISTIEKQIEDVTDPNKMPALYAKLQATQSTKDKYAAVQEELGLSADESEDNAARVQRKKQENTSWFNKLFPEGFPNVESVILWDIANGNRIRWTNKVVNGAVVSKGLGSELGLADSNAERTRRVALIGKDAPTPEEYAEQLPERLKAMGVRFEEGELRDKVLDVYASVDTVRKAKEELEKMSANIQAEQEGLDYEEEQKRRNYEREQESLRQDAQTEVEAAQTEQEQPANEETQEEELSIEDEVPFMVSSENPQAATEAQQLATEAAITALEDAGVEVVNATPEMVEEALRRRDVQMQAVNQRFNEQLDSFTEENANAVIFDLGMPSPMLMAGGVPNKPIRLYGSKLLKKIRKHGFSAAELSGLPMALANPIAVFNNYQREGNRSVLIELSTADGNFLVSIDIGVGSDIDFDIVKSVFGKDGDGILNWINKGYLTTVDKEKALAYLRISAPIAEASNKQELDSATKIVENFENPKIVPGNSFSIGPAPVFVSNAKIAVLGIKQEKATPEQWLKMIEKAGGLKAGEDKWLGLSDWLKASDKKTLTKQEVLDYINENQIQIEEAEYGESSREFEILKNEYEELLRTEGYDAAHEEMIERFGDDFDIAFGDLGGELVIDNPEAAATLLGTNNYINITRIQYTTDGLDNKREIALTVPTIEPWNENDEIHFGDAGEGRAIAWVRFGETTDADGKRVLVIDEIQSKRHQEGREKGYILAEDEELKSKQGAEIWVMMQKYNVSRPADLRGVVSAEDAARLDELARYKFGEVPEAPFEKNWAELAMKRMLRYAAENGFDKVAWTKGNQQAERYDIGSVVNRIESVDTVDYDSVLGVDLIKQVTLFPRDHSSAITLRLTPEGIVRASSMYNGEHIANIVGKEIGGRIMSDNNLILKGQDLRIGGEGMRAFYDQMLPSFMRKYGKKWGATVQDVTLPYVEEAGRTMHSVDVTDSMRESVMQGQPMFYRRPNGTVYGWTNGTTVYLTESGMNPNTPIHEYTHIWADAMRKHNPEGWKSIVKLLKGTPVWNEVMADANYANIHGNENQVASEALSRISGRENAAKMEAMAQQMIDENANDTVKKHRARKLLDRMRKALQEFWSWVGKELFGIKNFESIEQVTDRILYDLVSGTGLNPVSSFDTSAAERENIIAKAQADGTYLKAPNGKDTNLTPEQWVTVRTKAFKRWFGDWESNAEVDAMQRRVLSWLSEKNLEWARGKSRDEIMEHFGNIPEPIAYIPVEYLGYLGQEVTNNRVYSGMGYFIDHVVNHHPGIGVEKYVRIQEVLSNPDEVKAIKDNGNDSIVFIKEIDRFNAVVIEIEQNKDGQIVWHKSFYDQRKKPYANKGVQLFSRSLEGGGSSIIRTEDSAHDSSLSVLNDTTNIRRNFVIPSESSKIVDANSEPLVVWHGGEFATDEFVANGSMHFGTKVAALQRILDNAWGYGSWSVARNADGRWNWEYTNPDDAGYDKQGETAFASPIDALVDAARIAAPKAVLRPYYVNIRNLERTEDQNSDWVDAVSFSMDAGYDGIIYRNDFEDEGEDSYVAFYPNQIKLADGSNTTFDSDNDDIRFSVDAELRKRTEKIASEAQKIADKFGLSNEIVVAETPEVFVNELQSENVADGLINPDAIAVFTPSGRIMVNAQMISDIAELPDSIMHEFTHNVTHGVGVRYRLQDTVLEVGEERFKAASRELFDTTQDPWVVADEIIATFVGNAANPTLYEGVDLVSGVVSGKFSTDEAITMLMENLTNDIRNGYVDVVEAMMPYVKEVFDEIKTNHDGPRKRAKASGDYRETQAETGRVRTRVQRYAGGQKKSDNRSNDESYIRHEGYQVNRATSENQAVERGRLEGVNEFSIGPGPVTSESQSQSGQENALTPQEDKAKDKALKQLDRLNKVINSLRQTVKQAERDNVNLANIVQAALEEEVKDGGINRFLDVPELISLIRSGMDKKSIESTMDRLSERLTDAIIKNREEQLAQLLQVQVQGTNAFGIPIGYAVDDDTRAMVEFFRENLSRDMNKIVKAMENADDKSLRPYIKSELNVWFTAYKEIEESRYNIKATQKDIVYETERSQSFYRLTKELKAKNAPEGQIKTAQEHRRQALRNKKAQKKAILVAKQTLAQELEGMISLLGGRLRDGRAIRAGRLSADKVYAKNFIGNAMDDVRVNDGTKTYQGTEKELKAKKEFHKAIRIRTAAYRSYAYMIQSISRNAIGGKGFLWDALMEGKNGWVDCNDKRLTMDHIDNQEILAHVQASGLNSVADLQRLFDKQLVDKNGNPYVFRFETDRTGRVDQDIRPTIGWATYIVLCFEQDDMAPTMEKMKITEEQVQQIRDMLPDAAKNFLKWSREMLSDRRQRIYNPASLERFGTQMANIPNYFPIRRLEKNRYKVEEVEQVASADSDQVTIMANALIKRVRNVVEIDFQQNPLELLKKHLERMNGFAANVPLARNVNILLNSSGFRDQLNEQGDPNTYEYFKAAAKVALSSYKPKPGALDSVMIELQGWLAAGKIAWRFFTALKQLLSIPAFWTYNVSPRYKAIFIRSVLWPAVKNGDEGKLVAVWKWGMDNIPQLKERWSSRYAGNEKLAQVKDTLTAQYIAKHAFLAKSVGRLGEWGMIPNAAVDLFACSIGCYAVYKFELEQLQKKGYSKEEADELAKRRASIAFNESQQSSEAAFIAPSQRDRTFLAVQVSLFNNSNFGYGRKEKLARKYLWQQTFNKNLREKRLALAKKRYLERFLNEERKRLEENNNKISDVAERLRPEEIDRMVESKRAEFSKRAEKEANRDAKMAYAKDVEDVVMFKWLLNMAWQMAPTAVAYWLSCAMRAGDDEDPENPLNAETLALMFATATFRNAIGGGLLESGLNGYGFTGLVGSEVEKTADILMQAVRPLWLTDEEAESFDPLAVWMAFKQCLIMGTGVDINVFANIFTGLVGLFIDRSRTTVDVLRILNAPKSMIREIEIIPFEDETLDNYTRRMAMMENVALDRMEELKEKPSSELNAAEQKVLRTMKKWEKNLITIRQAEAADVPYDREVDGRVVAAKLKQLDTDYTDLLKSLDLTKSGKNRAGKVELTEDERRRKKALRVATRVKGIHKMEESAAEVINNPEAYKKQYRQIVEEKRKLIEEWNQ